MAGRMLRIGLWMPVGYSEVNVDVKLVSLLIDETNGSGDHRVRSLNALQSENAESELIQRPRGCIFQRLDFQQKDGSGGVNAVSKGKNHVVITKCSAIEVE